MHDVFLERPNEDVSRRHAHLSLEALVALPDAFVKLTVVPLHLAVAFSLSSFPETLVGGLFVLGASTSWQRVVVLHGSAATRSSVLKVASELVSVLVIDDAEVKELALVESTRFESFFVDSFLLLLALLSFLLLRVFVFNHDALEHVSFRIFKFDVAISLIVRELAVDDGAVGLVKTRVLDSLVLLPVSVEIIAISVVVNTRRVPLIPLEVSLVELPVGKQDLHLTVLQLPVIKFTLDQLIWRAEESAKTLRPVILKLALEDGTVVELADAEAGSLVVFPVASVHVAVRVHDLSLAISLSLGDTTVVYATRDFAKLVVHVVNEGQPVTRHLFLEPLRNLEREVAILLLNVHVNLGVLLIDKNLESGVRGA